MSTNSAPVDARAYPERPIVGVGAVVLRVNAVLLVQRGREPMLDRWSLPGGAVQLGELLRDAIEREVFEETAVRVSARRIVATLDRIVHDAAGRVQYHYVLVDWLCDADEDAPEARAGDDASAVRWVPLVEIRTKEYALEELTLEIIDKAIAARQHAAPGGSAR